MYLPISPYFAPYLPISPYKTSHYITLCRYISLYFPIALEQARQNGVDGAEVAAAELTLRGSPS